MEIERGYDFSGRERSARMPGAAVVDELEAIYAQLASNLFQFGYFFGCHYFHKNLKFLERQLNQNGYRLLCGSDPCHKPIL